MTSRDVLTSRSRLGQTVQRIGFSLGLKGLMPIYVACIKLYWINARLGRCNFFYQFFVFPLANSVARVGPPADWKVKHFTAAKYRYHVRLVFAGVTALPNDEIAIL